MKASCVFVLVTACWAVVLADAWAGPRVIIKPGLPRAIVVAPPRPTLSPSPRPVPPRAALVGYIKLMVRPVSADVYLNGVYKGRVYQYHGKPDFMTVPAGSHTVTLRQPGYKTEQINVQIKPARLVELDVSMNHTGDRVVESSFYKLSMEDTGSLVLKVDPPDASVYIDKTFYGSASEFSNNELAIVLREGTHLLQLVHPSCPPYEGTIQIESDKVKEVNLLLKGESL